MQNQLNPIVQNCAIMQNGFLNMSMIVSKYFLFYKSQMALDIKNISKPINRYFKTNFAQLHFAGLAYPLLKCPISHFFTEIGDLVKKIEVFIGVYSATI